MDLPGNETMTADGGKSIQDRFLALCREEGARVVEAVPVTARLAVFPQMNYTDEALRIIRERIQAEQRAALMNFPRAGILDDFIVSLDIPELWVICRGFFEYQLQARGCPDRYRGRRIVEIGHPFAKHPLFPEIRAEYLLAVPTVFSFPHEEDKWTFLENVLALLDAIPPGETVLYKEHNGQKFDILAPLSARQQRVVAWLNRLPFSLTARLLKRVARKKTGSWSERAGRFYTWCLAARIRRRTVRLSERTPHSFLAMEVFLPGIEKGVIGGLSNSIWQALYYEIPFYNCVDIETQRRDAPDRLYSQDAKNQLELNLRYFLVPGCRGKLEFDPAHFDIVDSACRGADLVEIAKARIIEAAGTSAGRV
jgi:hypothetical protein